jgi:hypothetical protein
MKTLTSQTLSSRWFAILVHICFWLLLYLAASRLGGKAPPYADQPGSAPAPANPIPVSQVQRLINLPGWPKLAPGTNVLNPFFTEHFIPPVTPAPPPPTTRKIELVYQGFYVTDGSMLQTMIKMGDQFLVTPVGGKITANIYAADAKLTSLLLTNSAGLTNLLMLNTKKEIEVPIP